MKPTLIQISEGFLVHPDEVRIIRAKSDNIIEVIFKDDQRWNTRFLNEEQRDSELEAISSIWASLRIRNFKRRGMNDE